jgi:hypothetical protein
MNDLSWLLDPADPGARYLALRDLCDLPFDDPELVSARQAAYTRGPIAEIITAMHPDGYWVEPGPGYNPKYTATVWAIILLAQLGASAKHDPRIARGCAYLLDHTLASGGQFTTTGAPSGTVDCLQGNLCWALLELEYEDDRLTRAVEWMARTVTGEGIAPIQDRDAQTRYYAGKCGPLFVCGANNKLSCAWGAAKVMLAFSSLPGDRRTPLIERAIQAGIGFLLDNHPAQAGYPNGWAEKPSGNWWKFGFPVFYITDLLQIVEAVARLGCGSDPRLADALQLVRQKQDAQGRLALEYDYTGKTYGSYGEKRQPNKWVTIRALRTLHLL